MRNLLNELYARYKTRPRAYLSERRIKTSIECSSLLSLTDLSEDGMIELTDGWMQIFEVEGVELYLGSEAQRERLFACWGSVVCGLKCPVKIIAMDALPDYGAQKELILRKTEGQEHPVLRKILERSYADYEFYEREAPARRFYLFVYMEHREEAEAKADILRELETVGCRLRTPSPAQILRMLNEWIFQG